MELTDAFITTNIIILGYLLHLTVGRPLYEIALIAHEVSTGHQYYSYDDGEVTYGAELPLLLNRYGI
jgi:hypothetical protein